MKTVVKETQSNEVDWTKNPQLVIGIYGTIILTTHDQSESDRFSFSGVVVVAGKTSENIFGDYDKVFAKRYFKPFHGTIELSND